MADKIYNLQFTEEETNTLHLALSSYYEDETRRARKEQEQGFEDYHTRMAEALYDIMGRLANQKEAQSNE